MAHNLVQVTDRVTAVLERLGVRNFVAGSFASTLDGMVHTTQDSDLVAELNRISKLMSPQQRTLCLPSLSGTAWAEKNQNNNGVKDLFERTINEI